jgi:hypothetical protein
MATKPITFEAFQLKAERLHEDAVQLLNENNFATDLHKWGVLNIEANLAFAADQWKQAEAQIIALGN